MLSALLSLTPLWGCAEEREDAALPQPTSAADAPPASPGAPPDGGDTPGDPSSGTGGATEGGTVPSPTGPFATSQRNAVEWKRHAILEADLVRGLELDASELCKELGNRSCIRDIHVVALGGNDPFGSGILRVPEETLSTTPGVVDRVVLSACSARARRDRDGPPRVFTELVLSGAAPPPQDPAVDATATTLFRRLLARDPKTGEVEIIRSLLASEPGRDALTAEEFAALACFVVGTSLEFLFY